MGFRFRKTIKIASGLKLNLSKSGVSTSIGGKGLTINLRRGKTRTTVGIPGTGMSYSATSASPPSEGAKPKSGVFVLLLIFAGTLLLFLVLR